MATIYDNDQNKLLNFVEMQAILEQIGITNADKVVETMVTKIVLYSAYVSV